ncbi:hypothetical protein B0H10DRAFT_2034079 [Mycena sp. CBHHK59/15]|nr:hypothetical protein B0H10DRAFT_2034079 [Mycena sp. CBHHK59/15]
MRKFLSLPLLILPAAVLASTHGHIPASRHAGAAHNATSKRASNAKFSLFDGGSAACGPGEYSNTEYIVAISTEQWDNGAPCYKEITISYGGKTANAQIVDECIICPYNGLDLTRGLFSHFADTNLGIIYGDWEYVGAGGNGGDNGGTTTTSSHTTTSTKHTTTPTSTQHSTTTSTPTSTAAKTSASSAAASSTAAASSSASATQSTGASAAAAPTDTGPQNIAQFSDALLDLAGLLVQGAQAA